MGSWQLSLQRFLLHLVPSRVRFISGKIIHKKDRNDDLWEATRITTSDVKLSVLPFIQQIFFEHSSCIRHCSRCLEYSNGFNRKNPHPLYAKHKHRYTHTAIPSPPFSACSAFQETAPCRLLGMLCLLASVRVWPMESIVEDQKLRGEIEIFLPFIPRTLANGFWSWLQPSDTKLLLGKPYFMTSTSPGTWTLLSACPYSTRCGNIVLPLVVYGSFNNPCCLTLLILRVFP